MSLKLLELCFELFKVALAAHNDVLERLPKLLLAWRTRDALIRSIQTGSRCEYGVEEVNFILQLLEGLIPLFHVLDKTLYLRGKITGQQHDGDGARYRKVSLMRVVTAFGR